MREFNPIPILLTIKKGLTAGYVNKDYSEYELVKIADTPGEVFIKIDGESMLDNPLLIPADQHESPSTPYELLAQSRYAVAQRNRAMILNLFDSGTRETITQDDDRYDQFVAFLSSVKRVEVALAFYWNGDLNIYSKTYVENSPVLVIPSVLVMENSVWKRKSGRFSGAFYNNLNLAVLSNSVHATPKFIEVVPWNANLIATDERIRIDYSAQSHGFVLESSERLRWTVNDQLISNDDPSYSFCPREPGIFIIKAQTDSVSDVFPVRAVTVGVDRIVVSSSSGKPITDACKFKIGDEITISAKSTFKDRWPPGFPQWDGPIELDAGTDKFRYSCGDVGTFTFRVSCGTSSRNLEIEVHR